MRNILWTLFPLYFFGWVLGLQFIDAIEGINLWQGGEAMFFPMFAFIDSTIGFYMMFRLWEAKKTIKGAVFFIPFFYGLLVPISLNYAPVFNVINILITVILSMIISNLISVALTFLVATFFGHCFQISGKANDNS